MGKVSVTGMYKLHTTRQLQMYSVATWYPNGKCYWSTFPFRQKTENLQGAVMKGAYIIDVSNYQLTTVTVYRNLVFKYL